MNSYQNICFTLFFLFCFVAVSFAQTPKSAAFRVQIETFIKESNFEAARELADSLVVAFKSTEDWENYLTSRLLSGIAAYEQRDYLSAQNTFTTTLKEHQELFGDTINLTLAELYQYKARVGFVLLENLAKAYEDAEKAVNYFQQTNHSDKAATVQRRLGFNHALFEGNFDKAIALISTALDTLNNYPEQLFNIAYCHFSLAEVYRYSAQFPAAKPHYEQVIDYSLANQDTTFLISTYVGLSYLLLNEYDEEEALDNAYKALAISIDQQGEKSMYTASVYNTIGSIYYVKGNYPAARTYFEKLDRIAVSILGENHVDATVALVSLGRCYRGMKDYEKAMEYFQKALAKKEALSFPDYEIFEVRLEIGNTYLIQGDSTAAREQYLSLYQLGENYLDSNNSLMWIDLYRKLAALSTDTAEANTYLNKASRLLLGNKVNVLDFELPDFEQLTDHNDLFRLIQSLTHNALLKYQKSQQNTDLELAYQYAQKGLDLLDYILLTQSTEESQLTFLEDAKTHLTISTKIGHYLYEISSDKKILDWVFQLIERNKALVLDNRLAKKSIRSKLALQDSIFQQEVTLLDKIAEKRGQLFSNDKENLDSIAIINKLFELKTELKNIKNTIATKYPEYAVYATKSTSLADAQNLLSTDRVALLEYFVADGELITFAITKDTAFYQRQQLLDDFEQHLAFMNELISKSPNSIKPTDLSAQKKAYQQSGFELYQFLLPPVLASLDEIDELIIIPDGKLSYLPFEILLTALVENTSKQSYYSLPYLFRAYNIHYEYAAKTVANLPSESFPHKKEVVAFAPQFEGQFTFNAPGRMGDIDALNFEFAFPELRTGYSPLEYNIQEVQDIMELVNGEFFVGEEANKENFKSSARNYSIIHIATHAIASATYPNYAHFVLSEPPIDSTMSRLLYAYELNNLNLNADLAVLSACQTGTGKVQDGEGIMSLARSFKLAGCPSILTSLNNINDRSTSELMQAFYRQLKNGNGKSDALKVAKETFLQNTDRFSHPYYWANFILIGDNTPISFGATNWYLWSSLLALLLLGVGLFLRKKFM